jgi:hypothetical protein
MWETVKHCQKCNDRLSSIAPRTENEIEFYRASRFPFGTIRDQDRLPLSQEGVCDNCGQQMTLTCNRIHESNRVTLES